MTIILPAICRKLLLALPLFATTACDPDISGDVSSSPSSAWGQDGASGNFALAPNAEAGALPPGLKSGKVYELVELIDLAQRTNPVTRIAWENARQAAYAKGMVEGTFLPFVSANIIAGRQDIVTPVRTLRGGTDNLTTTAEGVTPVLALQWLLFDFGERAALRDVASSNLEAANIAFNGTHQALIFDVTRAYYAYGATVSDVRIAEEALVNSRTIEEAARARLDNGTGTTIEVAQAEQLVAQSRLRLVTTQDLRRDAYHDVVESLGISPTSEINIATSENRRLPRSAALPTDDLIETALARRPDVLASLATVEAARAGERAADAAFLPKVYASAIAGANNTTLQTGNLPGLGMQQNASGLLLGISIPIYDGDIRANRRRQAASATEAAMAVFDQTRSAAARGIVVAADTLRSSLEAYEASTALVTASRTTYDATLEGYRNGIVPITDVAAGKTGLLLAQQAQTDAHAASLIAASALAFSLGNMTSRDAPAAAIRR
jgi:outer membrane protein TolC